MSKSAFLSVMLALGGCSFALQSGTKPHVAPIVVDTLGAAGAIAVGIAEERVTCDSSQWLCLSSIDHAVGGVALGIGAAFAMSALYGYLRYQQAPAGTTRDLADHVAVAAHAGDCATAAGGAAQLETVDRDAYRRLLDDEMVERCVARAR